LWLARGVFRYFERTAIDYLFSYEINAYMLFGIFVIVYAPYCLGIGADIFGDYPPKETKIEE